MLDRIKHIVSTIVFYIVAPIVFILMIVGFLYDKYRTLRDEAAAAKVKEILNDAITNSKILGKGADDAEAKANDSEHAYNALRDEFLRGREEE